jgi:hypothetical protein
MTQLIFARKSMVWYYMVMKLSAIHFIRNFNILPATITSGFLFAVFTPERGIAGIPAID